MASRTRSTRTAAPAPPMITVTNPASGAVVGEVVDHDADAVAALVARARAAQPAWAELGVQGRLDVIDRFRRRVAKHRELVIETLQAESGKPWEDCNGDVMLVVGWAQQLGSKAAAWLADETPSSTLSLFAIGRRNVITHEPIGVVGVIAPWNVPFSLGIGDALAPLVAGNTVVVKPSEITPLSAQLAEKLWLEAGGPADVLLVATGSGETGRALVDEVDHIHFTGSVETGRMVAQQAAGRLITSSLELGGKDPMIVLADADLDRAVPAAVHYALWNTGQICMSVERVYVEDAIHDEFVGRLVAAVQRLHQGVPTGPGSADLSALIEPSQIETVRAHVADAVSKGADVAYGGRITSGPGEFHQPTVLTGVDHSMLCMTEETFGPTIPVMRVQDAEEAVRLANDSQYGLTASVWTADLARGEALARRIEAGTVTVNDAMFHLGDYELPMGGWKTSGVGVRNGREGVRKFTRTKVVQVAEHVPSRDPSWFPYDPRTSRLLGEVFERVLGAPRLPSLPSVPTPASVVRTARRVVGR